MLVFPTVRAKKASTFLSVLQANSLDTNLKLCLDANDANSYGGSGQTWLDVSGGGYDFTFGADTGSSTDDPSFVSGSPSYMSAEAGDYFEYDSANETWMENLHKDNATYACGIWFYQPDVETAGRILFGGTGAGGSQTGWYLGLEAQGGGAYNFFLGVYKGLAYPDRALIVSSDTFTPTESGWNYLGHSLNEATGSGGGFFRHNTSYVKVSSSDTFDSTYNAPSSGAATNTFGVLGCSAGATNWSGVRTAGGFFIEGSTWTAANHDTFYNATKETFGL